MGLPPPPCPSWASGLISRGTSFSRLPGQQLPSSFQEMCGSKGHTNTCEKSTSRELLSPLEVGPQQPGPHPRLTQKGPHPRLPGPHPRIAHPPAEKSLSGPHPRAAPPRHPSAHQGRHSPQLHWTRQEVRFVGPAGPSPLTDHPSVGQSHPEPHPGPHPRVSLQDPPARSQCCASFRPPQGSAPQRAPPPGKESAHRGSIPSLAVTPSQAHGLETLMSLIALHQV